MRGLTYTLSEYVDNEELTLDPLDDDADLNELTAELIKYFEHGKQRQGSLGRLSNQLRPQFYAWNKNKGPELDPPRLPRNASSKDIYDVVDELTDHVRDHPSSVHNAWVTLTDPILDWYGEARSKRSSRHVSRETSPAKKTVQFAEPLGTTHSNAELLQQVETLTLANKRLAEELNISRTAYSVKDKELLESQKRVTTLGQLWEAAKNERAKAQTLQAAAELRAKPLEDVITAGAKRQSEFYAASAKLKELGLTYDAKYGWTRPVHKQPTAAELSLARHLFKNLDQ